MAGVVSFWIVNSTPKDSQAYLSVPNPSTASAARRHKISLYGTTQGSSFLLHVDLIFELTLFEGFLEGVVGDEITQKGLFYKTSDMNFRFGNCCILDDLTVCVRKRAL